MIWPPRDLARKFPGAGWDVVRQLLGHWPDVVRLPLGKQPGNVTGNCAAISPDITAVISPDTAQLLPGLQPYLGVRGWCLTKIPAFPFQKAATDFVRLNATKFSTDVQMTKH